MKIEIKKSELREAGVKDGWFVAVDADGEVYYYEHAPFIRYEYSMHWDCHGTYGIIKKSIVPDDFRTTLRQYRCGKLHKVNQ